MCQHCSNCFMRSDVFNSQRNSEKEVPCLPLSYRWRNRSQSFDPAPRVSLLVSSRIGIWTWAAYKHLWNIYFPWFRVLNLKPLYITLSLKEYYIAISFCSIIFSHTDCLFFNLPSLYYHIELFWDSRVKEDKMSHFLHQACQELQCQRRLHPRWGPGAFWNATIPSFLGSFNTQH